MAESILRELSTEFADKNIKLCETIKGHYSHVNQLELFVKSDILNRETAVNLYNRNAERSAAFRLPPSTTQRRIPSDKYRKVDRCLYNQAK